MELVLHFVLTPFDLLYQIVSTQTTAGHEWQIYQLEHVLFTLCWSLTCHDDSLLRTYDQHHDLAVATEIPSKFR
jgi:hypothetical protein